MAYLVYPAQELLRGVVMGVGQTGHRDQTTSVDGLFRAVEPGGIIGRADPLNGVGLDGDGSVGDDPIRLVEGDDVATGDQQVYLRRQARPKSNKAERRRGCSAGCDSRHRSGGQEVSSGYRLHAVFSP